MTIVHKIVEVIGWISLAITFVFLFIGMLVLDFEEKIKFTHDNEP